MPAEKIFIFAGSMEGGGSERQTLLLLQHLDRRFWQPHLYLMYRRGVYLSKVPSDVPIEAFWDVHTVPRIWIPGRIHRQQVRWLRTALIEQRPRVLYDRTYHATLVTAPAAHGLPTRRVSVITGPASREVVSPRESWAWLKRRRLAKAYRSAYATLAVSDASARDAEQFYRLPFNSVQTLPNPIDLQQIRQDAQRSIEWTMNADSLHIACVGRMTDEKGHAVLLEAMRLVRQMAPQLDWHLWLAGDGPLRPALIERTLRLELNDRVTFLGHLDHAARLIQRSDVLCLPSLYEGLPNVVLESMAVGVPVVATDAGGTREIGDRNALMLVNPGSPSQLADGLIRLLSDRSSARNQANAALETIARRDISVVLPMLQQVFETSRTQR